PWPAVPGEGPNRLWVARLDPPGDPVVWLADHGRPIRYGEPAQPWPIDAYQTVFATEPGSAEMPSAARGFTTELVTALVSGGVVIAPLLLHCGVAGPEMLERSYAEAHALGYHGHEFGDFHLLLPGARQRGEAPPT